MKNSMYKSVIFLVFGALSTMVWCFSAYAESNGSEKWHFQLAPYAWLAGQEGKVATIPPLPPADIDVDFYDEILGNINGALMLVGEARKGRFGLVMDIVYNDIETEDPKGKEKNWIQTIPGKGWNVILRFYGPLQAWFDQTWRPGDIEPIE
jgi:hypothetical protein